MGIILDRVTAYTEEMLGNNFFLKKLKQNFRNIAYVQQMTDPDPNCKKKKKRNQQYLRFVAKKSIEFSCSFYTCNQTDFPLSFKNIKKIV